MLLIFNLIYIIIKYSCILTLIKLISSAFGWEFGISTQYLRLLELLFLLGERRIEKVKSEHKLQLITELSNFYQQDENDDEVQERNEMHTINGCNHNLEFTIGDGHHQSSCESLQDKLGENGLTSSFVSSNDNESIRRPIRRISPPEGPPVFLLEDVDVNRREFHLADACKFVSRGISATIDDQVTKRFTPEVLKTWNLLTRTNAKNYQFMSRSLGFYWLLGFLIRYVILLPMRIIFTVTGFAWLIISMIVIAMLPKKLREKPYYLAYLMSFRMLASGLTSKLKFHNRQYRARKGDICVANHTSPLDIVLLACDNCYALVGQRHKGLLGIMENVLSQGSNHVWFNRDEMRDRRLVTERLKQHIAARSNLPVLIFPEGTCINNSAVMMFKKGSFETTDRVCPVAIKYDARFGDPFWNSSKHGYVQYLLLMMSSWAIKCDVWYLPPMERLNGETSAEFAGRVKAEIAKQGGLVDLAWDGQLKRIATKEIWKYQQQEDFVKRLKLE